MNSFLMSSFILSGSSFGLNAPAPVAIIMLRTNTESSIVKPSVVFTMFSTLWLVAISVSSFNPSVSLGINSCALILPKAGMSVICLNG